MCIRDRHLIISEARYSAAARMRAASTSASAGIEAGELALFTDGACKGNQHVSTSHLPAGWGVAVVLGRAHADGGQCIHELCGPVELRPAAPDFLGATVGSNNTGELTGICMALQWLIDEAGTAPAAICYDSEYAANQVQGRWKTNKNHGHVLPVERTFRAKNMAVNNVTIHVRRSLPLVNMNICDPIRK